MKISYGVNKISTKIKHLLYHYIFKENKRYRTNKQLRQLNKYQEEYIEYKKTTSRRVRVEVLESSAMVLVYTFKTGQFFILHIAPLEIMLSTGYLPI